MAYSGFSRGKGGSNRAKSAVRLSQSRFNESLASNLAGRRQVVSERASQRIGSLQAQRVNALTRNGRLREAARDAEKKFATVSHLGAAHPELMKAGGARMAAQRAAEASGDRTRARVKAIGRRIDRLARIRDTAQGLERSAKVNLKRRRKAAR